jgi:hypothetical protein
MHRWKIDYHGSSYADWEGRPVPSAYVLSRSYEIKKWFGRTETEWSRIGYYVTREEARAAYEKIKDLPEYLNG